MERIVSKPLAILLIASHGVLCSGALPIAQAPPIARETLFDSDWKFHPGDAPDWKLRDFDDQDWRQVTLLPIAHVTRKGAFYRYSDQP